MAPTVAEVAPEQKLLASLVLLEHDSSRPNARRRRPTQKTSASRTKTAKHAVVKGVVRAPLQARAKNGADVKAAPPQPTKRPALKARAVNVPKDSAAKEQVAKKQPAARRTAGPSKPKTGLGADAHRAPTGAL